ncbi:MAG: peptide chain release factor-like protein [Candidatus Peregrinibacteria bacterium]|nr:peptide chain release factor-like protein [Candidatus Peregrinibacteria bacterium]
MNFPIEIPPFFLQKALELQINPADISEDFIRGGGKGGQKINKTSSCVLLRHQPTGIEVRCQKHREQSSNRVSAYKLLILKIEEKIKGSQSQRQQEIYKLRKQKKKRSKRAKEKILEQKHHRSEIKENRGEIKNF